MNNLSAKDQALLEADLTSKKTSKKVDALRKVIIFMNTGRNMTSLFVHVMKCLELKNIEIKKLVYLFIGQYAKDHQEEATLVINCFTRDITDKTSPLLRSIAIRTMSYLRLQTVNEHLAPVLLDSLEDADPLVRRTMAAALPRICQASPGLLERSGLLSVLRSRVDQERIAGVFANVVLSLIELEKKLQKNLIEWDSSLLYKIAEILPECSEWVQVQMLEQIYTKTKDLEKKEIFNLIERIATRLSHSNPAVVAAACKLLLRMSPDENTSRFSGALSSLVSTPNEVRWVALKNLRLLIKSGVSLNLKITAFYPNYDEPPFIKHEKMKLLSDHCNKDNIKNVCSELEDCCLDLDEETALLAVDLLFELNYSSNFEPEIVLSSFVRTLELASEGQSGLHLFNSVVQKFPKLSKIYPESKLLSNLRTLLLDNWEAMTSQDSKINLLILLRTYWSSWPSFPKFIEQYLKNFKDESHCVQLGILNILADAQIRGPSVIKEAFYQCCYQIINHSEVSDLLQRANFYLQLSKMNSDILNKVVSLNSKIDLQFKDHPKEEVPQKKEICNSLFSFKLSRNLKNIKIENDNNSIEKLILEENASNIKNNNELLDLPIDKKEATPENLLDLESPSPIVNNCKLAKFKNPELEVLTPINQLDNLPGTFKAAVVRQENFLLLKIDLEENISWPEINILIKENTYGIVQAEEIIVSSGYYELPLAFDVERRCGPPTDKLSIELLLSFEDNNVVSISLPVILNIFLVILLEKLSSAK